MLTPDVLLVILPLLIVLVFSLVQVGRSRSVAWVLLGMLSGLSILVLAQLPLRTAPSEAVGTALVPRPASGSRPSPLR